MGTDNPRLTPQTLKVLAAFISSENELSGAEIARITKLASGTLYPILLRLEEARWLKSYWETEDPAKLGRPRRRFYQITALGERRTKEEFRSLRSLIGVLA
jgi:PadR family transcriptional regulator